MSCKCTRGPPNHSLEPWKYTRIFDGPGQLGDFG